MSISQPSQFKMMTFNTAESRRACRVNAGSHIKNQHFSTVYVRCVWGEIVSISTWNWEANSIKGAHMHHKTGIRTASWEFHFSEFLIFNSFAIQLVVEYLPPSSLSSSSSYYACLYHWIECKNPSLCHVDKSILDVHGINDLIMRFFNGDSENTHRVRKNC